MQDDICHGECFTGTSYTKQRLMFCIIVQSRYKRFDCLGLISFRVNFALQIKICHNGEITMVYQLVSMADIFVIYFKIAEYFTGKMNKFRPKLY